MATEIEAPAEKPLPRPSPRAIARSLFASFGPLIVFYAVDWKWGLVPAIGASTAYSVLEVVLHLVRKEPLTSLFKFSAIMTLVFGVVDVCAQQSVLFKYEAVASNVATAVLFASTLRGKGSLLQEYYEKSPQAAGRPAAPWRARFFRLLTLVWAGYFLVKAVLYVFVARHYSIEASLGIRAVVGNVSLVLMVGVTWLLARFFKARAAAA